ncbi:MAG TPA: ABC transporter permease [Ferruginibacter sp.]|nr:ABC transporter permease [Ferruginibacter sp.]HRO16582.1 ABC transporter permease [Ferruginibacter sp.]HRQ19909.1 ABC transporter permease [Ferruginibacter sp.]
MENTAGNKNEDWDLVISPKAKLLDINLKEVWRYRDLLRMFVKRDYKAQYKQTVLGPLWYLIQPIFTSLIFILIFGKIAKIPTDGIPPMLFYLSGICIWNYFDACLTSTSSTFVQNANIFGKVYFPRLVLPLSTVFSNMIKFSIQFLLLISVTAWVAFQTGSFYIGINWLLIPLLVLMMAGLGLGLGIIVSSLTTKYRDFHLLLSFGVQLLLYTTPVAYPLSFLKDKPYAAWIAWNPLAPIVETFRYAFFNVGSFDLNGLLYSAGCIIVILFIGIVLFNKVEKNFMDTV